MPLYQAFIDFEKAFNSVNLSTVMQALLEQMKKLYKIYSNSTAFVSINKAKTEFSI